MQKNQHPANRIVTGAILTVLLTLCGALTFTGCKKSPESAARELADILNKKELGIEFQAAPENTTALETPEGYRITFKNPRISVNTSIYKNTIMAELIKPGEIPVKMDAITYLYDRKQKKLFLEKIENLSVIMDNPPLQSAPAAPGAMTKIALQAESMSCDHLDLSAMLTFTGNDAFSLFTALMANLGPYNSTMTNLSYSFSFNSTPEKNISFDITIPKTEIRQKSLSEMLAAIYKKDVPIPDFSTALKENKTIFNVETTMENMTMKISGDNTLSSISLSKAYVLYSLEPNPGRTHFDFQSRLNLENLQLTLPNDNNSPLLQAFTSIPKCDFAFTLEHLSPNFLKLYLELTRMSMDMNKNQALAKDPEAVKKQMEMQIGIQGMALAGEFVSSGGGLKLDIDPLDTRFGKAAVHASFSMPAANLPVGKASVTLFDFAKIMENIKTITGIKPDEFKKIDKELREFFVTDPQGAGQLIVEAKKEEPGIIYFNGKPQK